MFYKFKLLFYVVLPLFLFNNSYAENAPYGNWYNYFLPSLAYAFNTVGTNNFGNVHIKQLQEINKIDTYHTNNTQFALEKDYFIESYEIKSCIMENMKTGTRHYKDFVVYLGTKGTDDNHYLYAIKSIKDEKGKPASYLYYDNNHNNFIDSGDTGFYVSCLGDGHPYTPYNISTTPTIMQIWARQDLSGERTAFHRKFFWQSIVRPPVNKYNPVLKKFAKSIIQSETFWAADDNELVYPKTGIWVVGALSGNYKTMGDGTIYPESGLYGRNMWHAKNLAPFWWIDEFLPPKYSRTFSYSYKFYIRTNSK